MGYRWRRNSLAGVRIVENYRLGDAAMSQPSQQRELMSKEDDLLLKELAHLSVTMPPMLPKLVVGMDLAEKILAKVTKHYRQKLKKAKAQGRKDGIQAAINNLKKHYCIFDTEARIKEIEEESNG